MKIITFLILVTNLLFANMGQLKVSYDPDYAPYSYNIDGKAYGLFIDIFKEWGDKNNYNIEFVNGKTWDNSLELAKNGQVDFFLGTDPYEDWMKSSKPYYKTQTSLFSLKNRKDDIKKIGIIGIDYKEEIKEEIQNVSTLSYDTYKELIDALINGKVDAIYDDGIAISDFILKHNKSHLIIKLDIFSTKSDICAISSKQSLIKLFDKGFDNIDYRKLKKLEDTWIFNQTQKYYTQNKKFIKLTNEDKLHLTKEEKNWLQSHPKITVHNEKNWAPINFNKHNKAQGLSIDYMNLLSSKIGLEVEYITGEWDELYNKVINKKLDVMLNISKSKQREKDLLFTDKYQKNRVSFFANKNSPLISNIKDLYGKKVAIVKGFIYESFFKKNYPLIKIVSVKNTQEALRMVSEQKVDATISSYIITSYIISEMAYDNIKFQIDFKTNKDFDLYIAIRDDYPLLQSILQKAMATVSYKEINDIRKKWLLSKNKKSIIGLTKEQLQWIEKHQIIHVGGEKDWPPFDFVDQNNQYSGLSKDYLDYIQSVTGLQFEVYTGKTWSELLSSIKDGTYDMLPAIYYSKDRESFVNFTSPYLKIADYYITLADYPRIDDIKSLYGKKVAAIKGYAVTQWLKQKHPKINLVEVDTQLDALRLVESGAVVSFLNDNPSTTYTIEKNFISNIKINNIVKGRTPIDLHMAVKKGYEPLVDIINKALLSIPMKQRRIISEKWMKEIKSDKARLNLTKDEKQWMEQNRIVKFAVMNYWPHDENGESFHTAMLKLLNKYAGTNFIPVKYGAWSDGYSLAKEGVDLHGIMGLSYSKEREEKYFHYTPAYNFSPSYIVVKDTNYDIKELQDLEGKTIYLKTKSISHKIVETNLKNTSVIDLSTIDEMYKNLSTSKKVDAFISYFVDKKILDKYHLKIAKTMYEKYGETSIGVSHKYPLLASIIKKAYDIIPKKEIIKIRDKKWNKVKVDQSNLNEKQIKYLKNKKVLKICTNPNWTPIEFHDGNKPKGISIDILNFIKDTVDLQYKFIKTTSWSQSQEFLREKKCDILPSAIKTKKREKYAKFTKPYLNYDLAIITKDDQPLSQNMDSFLDKTMSRKKGSGLISKIKSKYPTIGIKETSGAKESFDSVIDSDVDFTIATLPVLQYYKSKYSLKGLQVAGYTNMKYNLSMAVRDDEPILVDIINIALDKLSPQTYKIVHDKWASVKVLRKTNWTLIFQLLGIVLLVVLLVLWNNRKLKSMVDEKTADIEKQKNKLQKLLTTLDKNVITSETNEKGIITYASDAFSKISGFSKDELIGKSHKLMRHPDMKKEVYDDLWKTIKSGKIWRGEIKNRKKDGNFYWVKAIITPKTGESGEIVGYTAIRYDITDKKEVEDLTANLEIKIEERTVDLEEAKKEIEATHKHTRESIEYASMIQGALLPDEKLLDNYFKDSFVHWMPKDTVGGDIWLFNELRHQDECLLFFIDCTGHGVPGAFVTMIVKAIEREIVANLKKHPEFDISPAIIMSHFNKTMKVLLKQETNDSKSNAGWDGGIIYYNKKDKVLKFAGAETPLFYVDTQGEFHTAKGNRYSVGYKKCDMDYDYKESIIEVQEGMKFYCTTDGYLDQNGGEKDFPFGKKRFGNIIKKHHTKAMSEQKNIFIDEMDKYESMIKDNDRNDDMTVIGFEI